MLAIGIAAPIAQDRLSVWRFIEVGKLLLRHGQSENQSGATWPNIISFTVGLAIMYFTALLVAV